jgi:hypothetical protein
MICFEATDRPGFQWKTGLAQTCAIRNSGLGTPWLSPLWDGTGYHINSFCQKLDTPQRTPLLYCIPWRIHGAAIYGVPWNPSTKTPVMLAFFYQHQPDPMIRGWESDGISVQVLSGLVFLPWKIHKVPHKESHEISHELHLPSSSLT